MALYVKHGSNNKNMWQLSYKDTELSKKAESTYEWIECGRKGDKVFYYSKPDELKNIQGITPDTVCFAFKCDGYGVMVSNDQLLLISASEIKVDHHPELIKFSRIKNYIKRY